MAPVLAFDVETVPDVAGIRQLHDLPADLSDQEVAEVALQKRRVQTGSDFLGPQLQLRHAPESSTAGCSNGGGLGKSAYAPRSLV